MAEESSDINFAAVALSCGLFAVSGGLGNQLMALAGTALAAACAGRRPAVGVRRASSVAGWLWEPEPRGLFEPPAEPWRLPTPLPEDGGVPLPHFLQTLRASPAQLVAVTAHHQVATR